MLKEHPPVVAGVTVAALRIEQLAVAIAPHRTGHYAESFEVRIDRRKDRTVAVVRNTDDGALSIEYGTSDTPAHRTLRTASLARQL